MHHTQLTLSHGAGGGAPLCAHTVRDSLPRGGRCCRLMHLDWHHQQLWLWSDPWLCLSVRWWLVGRGGLRNTLRTAERWWAGHWVGSGTVKILLVTGEERRSISRQCPLHKGSENSLKGHPWTKALCTRRLSWHHRMHRACLPGRWWSLRGPRTVCCGPRVISPPAPAGGGGIPGEIGNPLGIHTMVKKHWVLSGKTEGTHGGNFRPDRQELKGQGLIKTG